MVIESMDRQRQDECKTSGKAALYLELCCSNGSLSYGDVEKALWP